MKARRVSIKNQTAILVEGVTHAGGGSKPKDGVTIIGGARAERCDWVILKTAHRWVRQADGGLDYIAVPGSVQVHGVRASEAAAHAEAHGLRGGIVIQVEGKESK